MGYFSKNSRRANEMASMTSHSHIINDTFVEDYLSRCVLPKKVEDVDINEDVTSVVDKDLDNPITNIIAIDGGYTSVFVEKSFPSSEIFFFQFGALFFSLKDLDRIDNKSFIDPEDMSKLKAIQRFKLVLPGRNISLKDDSGLKNSFRRSLYEFFCTDFGDGCKLVQTLKWFLFQEYSVGLSSWSLASCPMCDARNVDLNRSSMENDFSFSCSDCSGKIYITDVLRLHEVIDDEVGAGGVMGYVCTAIEQFILVHLIRIILDVKPGLLSRIMFVKDGPLAFFGQTANMHKPMRCFVKYLLDNHSLYLVGVEKSGVFVEHADEISSKLRKGQVVLLSNDYIYKYIIPGNADPTNAYGRTTYYGNKLIYKSLDGGMYVATVPTGDLILSPSFSDLQNLDIILVNLQKLKCDMYDNALIPIALANKLVSLANHPSSRILEKFARKKI